MLIVKRKKNVLTVMLRLQLELRLWLWQEDCVGGASFSCAFPQSRGQRGDADAAGTRGLSTDCSTPCPSHLCLQRQPQGQQHPYTPSTSLLEAVRFTPHTIKCAYFPSPDGWLCTWQVTFSSTLTTQSFCLELTD